MSNTGNLQSNQTLSNKIQGLFLQEDRKASLEFKAGVGTVNLAMYKTARLWYF